MTFGDPGGTLADADLVHRLPRLGPVRRQQLQVISRRPAADPGLHPGCARRDLADGQRVLRAAAGGADHAGRGLRAHSRNVGLVVAMALLTIHGWLAGRAAQLQGWKLLVATSIAAGLGLVMILLKDLVLIHLH